MNKSIQLLFLLTLSISSVAQSNKTTFKIAFGSCSDQKKVDKQLWEEVAVEQPDLWIWLGDNIYGDSENLDTLKLKYDKQKSHPDYQKLIDQTRILGIWDDHDYGLNDGGKEYPSKDGSRDLLFEFLEVAEENPAWNRKGAHQSYVLDALGKKMKLILLDTRYFRDALIVKKDPKRTIVNPTGDILGEEQWKWFEKELKSDADIFLIASGIQVLPSQHNFEKWSNFPKDRNRLLERLKSIEQPVILLSGDRHISEVSKLSNEEYRTPIYEFTSSGLTNVWSQFWPETNDLRVGPTVFEPNFGVLEMNESENGTNFSLSYIGTDNTRWATFKLDDLQLK